MELRPSTHDVPRPSQLASRLDVEDGNVNKNTKGEVGTLVEVQN